jgi:hypothetical protein
MATLEARALQPPPPAPPEPRTELPNMKRMTGSSAYWQQTARAGTGSSPLEMSEPTDLTAADRAEKEVEAW